MSAYGIRTVHYDIVDDCIVVTYDNGTVERFRVSQIRQMARWRDGKPQVAEVLGVREMPVKT